MAPVIYFAVTGHGFGHAVRSAAVAAQVQRLCPEVTLILTTSAPRWLLSAYIPGAFIHRPRSLDVGVIQADSLQMDRPATLTAWQEIQARQNQIIAGEVAYLQNNRVSLVIADVPPLAATIAHRAGVPCWWMSNFGWDEIYEPWGEDFLPLVQDIRHLYAQGDRLFRLPLATAMAAFPPGEGVGLVGGDPRQDLGMLRETYNLTVPRDRTVLLSFGGLGLNHLPYEGLKQFPDWQFITFDAQAPDLPNLRRVANPAHRPVDFMPLCDRVVSKPGFSTFAEALKQDLPVVTVTREDFAEGPVLLAGLRAHGYHQIITPEALFSGDWQFLREPLSPPQTVPLDKRGTETIAEAIVRQLT
jgi:hypothetical protein